MATIKGLERFQSHFVGFEEQFVLIGGVACHLWFEENGLSFRPTKDFDIVLVTEALSPQFVRRIWEFVDLGRYLKKERSDSEHRYYRFSGPEEPDFPYMIELFARRSDGLEIEPGQHIIPISVVEENVSSLSAILLDENYYRLISNGRSLIGNLPLVAIHVLIPLKAKAWLDLTVRREGGQQVDSNLLSKHRSDVFRLALLLTRESQFTLPQTVATDLQEFLQACPVDSPEWAAIAASLKTVVNPVPSAITLREAIIKTFDLGAVE